MPGDPPRSLPLLIHARDLFAGVARPAPLPPDLHAVIVQAPEGDRGAMPTPDIPTLPVALRDKPRLGSPIVTLIPAARVHYFGDADRLRRFRDLCRIALPALRENLPGVRDLTDRVLYESHTEDAEHILADCCLLLLRDAIGGHRNRNLLMDRWLWGPTPATARVPYYEGDRGPWERANPGAEAPSGVPDVTTFNRDVFSVSTVALDLIVRTLELAGGTEPKKHNGAPTVSRGGGVEIAPAGRRLPSYRPPTADGEPLMVLLASPHKGDPPRQVDLGGSEQWFLTDQPPNDSKQIRGLLLCRTRDALYVALATQTGLARTVSTPEDCWRLPDEQKLWIEVPPNVAYGFLKGAGYLDKLPPDLQEFWQEDVLGPPAVVIDQSVPIAAPPPGSPTAEVPAFYESPDDYYQPVPLFPPHVPLALERIGKFVTAAREFLGVLPFVGTVDGPPPPGAESPDRPALNYELTAIIAMMEVMDRWRAMGFVSGWGAVQGLDKFVPGLTYFAAAFRHVVRRSGGCCLEHGAGVEAQYVFGFSADPDRFIPCSRLDPTETPVRATLREVEDMVRALDSLPVATGTQRPDTPPATAAADNEPTEADLVKALRYSGKKGKAKPAALVEFMARRDEAPDSEVAMAVHRAKVSPKAIRSNCDRANEEAEAVGCPFRYRLIDRHVQKYRVKK